MKEINKLEAYIQQRAAERKKRTRRLIVAGGAVLVLGLGGFAYVSLGGKANGIEDTRVVDSEPARTPPEKINMSPVHGGVQPKEVALSIKGKFEVGERLDFILENANGKDKHSIGFGDSQEMSIQNRTQHIYKKAGEYKVKFLPAGAAEAIVETIRISEKIVDEKTQRVFTQTIEGLEAKSALRAFQVDAKVDKAASFPGGSAALMAYFQTHIGPVSGYKGRILVGFDIGADGVVSNISIVDGMDAKTNQQILTAFKGMPAWTPAQKNGGNVSSRYQLPFYFDESQ